MISALKCIDSEPYTGSSTIQNILAKWTIRGVIVDVNPAHYQNLYAYQNLLHTLKRIEIIFYPNDTTTTQTILQLLKRYYNYYM